MAWTCQTLTDIDCVGLWMLFLLFTREARMFSLCLDDRLLFAGNGGRSQHERSHQALELG